jgi:hypothetical protein
MMKINKRWLRSTLWVIAGSVLLLFGFVYFFLEGIIISRLEGKLDNSYGTTYKITYNEITYSVSFKGLSAELTDVKIRTDIGKAKKMNSPVIDLDSKSISVSNVSLRSFFVFSKLDVNTITIEDPRLSIARNKDYKIDKKSNSVKDELDPSTNIKRFGFEEFIIKNGSAAFFDDIKMTDTLFRLKELNFRAKEFESIEENLSELLILDKYKSINVQSKSFKLNLGKDKYSIFVKEFKGELIAGDIKLRDIHFKPPTDNLRKGKEYRSEIKINKLDLSGVKYIMDDKINLSADSVVITDTHIDLTKNQALSKHRKKVLWMKTLLSLKEEIAIHTLRFQNCSFSTEIKNIDGNKNYKLELKNLNGRVSNIKTRGNAEKLKREEAEKLKINLHSNVFKTGELNMAVTLSYDDPLVSNFEGTISNIDLKSFNELIVKMFSLKIEEGMLSKLSFRGISNDNVCKGKLIFEYKDLKGSFIKERNGESKQAKLISKLMNLVIHSSNPHAGESQPEEVSFAFTKEAHHGQIMLWLGGVIDGALLTIIGKKKHDFLLNNRE